MAISPDTQKRLYAETDARFAAQSGITRKLDPKNAVDKTFIPAWTDIYRKVVREYEAGILAWTYDNPFVVKSLEAGSILADKAAGHFDDATKAAAAGLETGIHLGLAEAARAAAALATRTAATAQPIVIDPALTALAAAQTSQIAQAGAQTSHDAVAAAQGVAAGGHAMGVHTPGDPNALHFTMQGGQESVGPGLGGAAGGIKRDWKIGAAIAAGAVGIGLLASAGVFKAAPQRRSGGGKRRSAAVVIQNGGRR